jgi:hypothetical protein
MEMALPKGIPTLQHMHSKNYSRPDNVFCSTTLQPHVVKCKVEAHLRPPATDHFPILTQIDLPQLRILPDPSFNFRVADWDEFRQTLANKPSTSPRTGQRCPTIGKAGKRPYQNITRNDRRKDHTQQTTARRKTMV